MSNSVKGADSLDELIEEVEGLGKIEDTSVSAGFPAESSGEGPRSMAETALVAAVHEFGAMNRGVPPRPFIRPAVDEDQDDWFDQVEEDILIGVLEGGWSAEKVFGRAGEQMVKSIQRKIRERSKPKLSEEYVKNDPIKKDRSNALIRHGWMKNSVNYEVEQS